MTLPLTICTVSYHHAPHLRLNMDLVAALNPDADIRWIIGENTPEGSPLRLQPADAPGALLLDTRNERGLKDRPAYNHIAAMSACIDRVETRFMLVLDPDFFVVQPNWAADVIAHMQERRIALFGAPWHPRHERRYRYFPCVHFTLVDRDAFSHKPYTAGIIAERRRQQFLKTAYYAPGKRAGALRQLWRGEILRRLFMTRWKLSWWVHDTGSELFGRYWTGEAIANECLIPIFRPADFHEPQLLESPWSRFVERLMPDYMSYLPKRSESYSETGGFLTGGEATEFWEEFLWRGQPFGFHMRGHPNRSKRDAAGEIAVMEQQVRAFIQLQAKVN